MKAAVEALYTARVIACSLLCVACCVCVVCVARVCVLCVVCAVCVVCAGWRVFTVVVLGLVAVGWCRVVACWCCLLWSCVRCAIVCGDALAMVLGCQIACACVWLREVGWLLRVWRELVF